MMPDASNLPNVFVKRPKSFKYNSLEAFVKKSLRTIFGIGAEKDTEKFIEYTPATPARARIAELEAAAKEILDHACAERVHHAFTDALSAMAKLIKYKEYPCYD